MGTTRTALIPRVRDLLADTPYTTTSSTTGTGSTVTVPDGTRWSEGDIGEWQTGTVGYEQFLVAGDPVGNDLPVSRGYGGTTAETHTSGDRIAQNPGFLGRNVQQQLAAGVRTLWPFVYKTASVTLAVLGDGTDPTWWNIAPANGQPVLGLVGATQLYGNAPLLAVVEFGRTPGWTVELDTSLPTALVATGVGVRFPAGLIHQTNDVTVVVQQAVTGDAGDADIEDTGQFPVADYLVTYAAGRLTAAQEIPRVAGGTDLETTGTVGTGSRMETGRTFLFEAKKQLEMLAIKYRMHYRPLSEVGS